MAVYVARDIQSPEIFAKSGIGVEQKGKSYIKFLIHPMKGKVDAMN